MHVSVNTLSTSWGEDASRSAAITARKRASLTEWNCSKESCLDWPAYVGIARPQMASITAWTNCKRGRQQVSFVRALVHRVRQQTKCSFMLHKQQLNDQYSQCQSTHVCWSLTTSHSSLAIAFSGSSAILRLHNYRLPIMTHIKPVP